MTSPRPAPAPRPRQARTFARRGPGPWARFGAGALLAPFLLSAACAGAQEPPAGDPAPPEQVRPPERAGAPSIRPEWAEPRVRRPASDDASTVTVSGTGRVEAAPDRARVLFAVETEGRTAAEAGEANARLMTEVSRALREAGADVSGFTLGTAGYALMPQYGPVRDGRREITGYMARNSVRVVADDVEAAGPLIDTALAAGANRVSGLQFELSDPEPHRHRAVAEAIRVARTEAEVMAEALGMELGQVVAVEGGADTPSPRFVEMGQAVRVEAAPTPVEPGVQTVTAHVTLRFRLVEDR